MMPRTLLLLALLAQPGCAVAIYGESRQETREGITPPLAVLAPEVPTEGAADCVMRSLTQVEILTLPNSGTLDDPAQAEAFVKGVLARPGAAACLAAVPKGT
jgi:hypothetical protein